MCTYLTLSENVVGSAKGPNGDWFGVSAATVYYDHPVHALAEHTLNIDVAAPARGPSARVALELEPGSARRLAEAILAALDSAPPGLSGAGRR